MPHRRCRKSTKIALCGIICLFLWQASIYPVQGKVSDIKEMSPYVVKQETNSVTDIDNTTSKYLTSETTRHVIQRGDTLWDLARRYQTTVDELVSLNQFKSPNQVREGQPIWVVNRQTLLKTQDQPKIHVITTTVEVPKIATEVKIAEATPYTPWWVNVLRKISVFAAINKQDSKDPISSDFLPLHKESKVKTYEIFVKDTEPTEMLSISELADINDDRSKLMNNKHVSIMTSENQIHSRGLGRFVTLEEVELLTRVIYGEARGEDFLGQVAVGAVVLNRLKDPRFPKTIRSIVYQSGAFTAVDDRQIHLDPDDQAYRAAKAALSGLDPSNGAIFYYNPRIATDRWIKSRPVIKRIGNHAFSI